MVRHGGVVLQPLTGAPRDPREVRHKDVGGIYGQPHPAVPPDVRLGTQPRSPHRHRLQHPVPSHAGEQRCVRPVGEPAFQPMLSVSCIKPWKLPHNVQISTAATAQGPGQLPNSPFQARKIVCASLAWHDIGQLPTGMVWQVAEFEK